MNPAVPLLIGALMSLPAPQVAVADDTPDSPEYVGSQVCGDCHQAQFQSWRGSHHDLAMAEASDRSVLGDFNDVEFTAHGVTSRFYRKDEGFWVRTDGPDGKLTDYRIAYTFGWTPLQQYLIEFPRGRLQALGIAWDTRPADQGGQRWFHLYPNEQGMDYRNPLHWTGREQTWNYQCAACHSTRLRKGYQPADDSYDTTWAEINVGCEACHGPGSVHAAQAKQAAAGDTGAWDAKKGLAVDLAERDGGTWGIDPESGLPQRSVARSEHTQIAVCAPCHSRRGQIHEGDLPGRPLSDGYRLSLLEDRLYFADGQIKDEVFVHGSFLQSRMYAKGVTCSDCHDMHSLHLKQPGNGVCAQCHPAARYDTPAHHHHPSEADSGTSCVDCHMPQRLYMVVDARADHGIRVPRPDLTLKIGTPNACNQCHTDKSAAWSAAAVTDWYGPTRAPQPHFGEALHAAWSDAPDADRRLAALAADTDQPAIARATAIDLLATDPRPVHALLMPRLSTDSDPLIRAAVGRYLEQMPPDSALRIGLDLLGDPIRLVRIDTARALAPLVRLEANVPGRPSPLRAALDPALDEYRAAQLVNADRPEAQLNLGVLASLLGDSDTAEKHDLRALELDAGFVPGYVNLADLYRAMGRDDAGRSVLETGLRAAPDSADLHHALGLLEVRAGQLGAAVPELARAAELAPDNARYAYAYALAEQAHGEVDAAIQTLDRALERHPGNRDIGLALISINAEAGHRDAAIEHAEAHLRRHPDDAAAKAMLEQLQQAQTEPGQ